MSRGDDGYNISASQVKAHSQCALQWEYRYRSDKEPTKKASKYLKLGSRVHEAIEDCLSEENGPPLNHKPSVRATIQNNFRDNNSYPLPDDLFETGLECCETAAGFIVDGPGSVPDDEWEPVIRDVELRKEYDIKRDDLDTGVTAIMDVTTHGEIWDWKTGSIRDRTPHEEKIQGAMYMAAYYEKYDEVPEKIRFVYVKEGKVRNLDPDDDIWEYMVRFAKELVKDKHDGTFEANPGDHCYWCGFEMFCPASAAGVGSVPWEEY